MVWLAFLLSAGLIVLAGSKLSHYGDRIAAETGLGGLWIGVVLLAGATSLPEVLTTVSAGWLDAPDLAVGNLLGAGLTNMLTLGLIDAVYRSKRVWQQAALEQALVAALAIVLTGFVGLLILLRPTWPLGRVGLDTLLVLLLYVFGMRAVFRQEDLRRRQKEQALVADTAAAPAVGRRGSLRRALIGFALAALGILLGAPVLATSAKAIADQTGISTTFIGSSLVAIATSLPELVTAFAAVRLGAFDMAVGNLYGSNAFNMGALFFADLAYGKGPILSAAAPAHVVTALAVILLMGLGLMGIMYRAEKRFRLIEPDSLLMVLGYALGMWVLFRVGG
jgi:cation:H+ antiporter